VVPNARATGSGSGPVERLFVALDTPAPARALTLARDLQGRVGGFKVGLELFTAGGPQLVTRLVDTAPVFLDLKFHDMPNTVAGAAALAGRLGVSYFTMHAGGGAAMIRAGVEAAREAAESVARRPPTALAVTVLTSHDDATLSSIGMQGPCAAAVERLAVLATEAGAGGLVCSALELARVRGLTRGVLAVPGIRPAGVETHDQSRVATPAQAVRAGADLLVIGRPITRADDPRAAADAIVREIAGALG